MPTIKTGEWLKATLKRKGMTQKQLAQEAGVSLPAVAKIISGERYGSPETWDKLLNVLDEGICLSVASSDFICELAKEIKKYGANYICNVFYKEDCGNIIFKDYLLPEDMEENCKNDLKEMNMIQITLKEALELFKLQDSII